MATDAPPAAAAPAAAVPEHDLPTFTIGLDPAVAAKEAAEGKKLAPFTAPLPSCTPPAPAALTAEQTAKYDELLAHMRSLATIPVSSAKAAEATPLADDERLWLTRQCLLRYLRAAKWALPEAKKRVVASLVWRREYGVAGHTADYISPENETGKQYILGFDNDGRPCLYLNPARQNTKQSERQIQHLVWMLERVVDFMPPGQENLALVIDFKSSSSSSNPSVGTGKQVLGILQNHYPERLGRALIANVPWFVWGFFKLINPFIDPLTREKLKFNEDLKLHVPAAQLDTRFGGECVFEYDHATYWPELDRLATQKREAMAARWRALGSEIGADEVVLKGGVSDGGAEAAGTGAEVEAEKKVETETKAEAEKAETEKVETEKVETEKAIEQVTNSVAGTTIEEEPAAA